MVTVNDMFKDSKLNNVPLLSNFNATFWLEYVNNFSHYDAVFSRLYKSFEYFMQEDGQSVSEIRTDFTNDVYNHLLVNKKRYEELYRINILSNADYDVTDNYYITENMNKTNTSKGSVTEGEREDETYLTSTKAPTSESVDVTTDPYSNTKSSDFGKIDNTTTNSVSAYDTESFHNSDKSVASTNQHTDTVTENRSTMHDSTVTTTIERTDIDDTTYTKGSQINSRDLTDTENYTLTRKGNIGVQAPSDMLKKHNQFWDMYEFYTKIFRDICSELLSI